MPQINYDDYEALTVVELKEIADSQGVDIPHDARKADIIDALAAAAKKEGLLETPPPAEQPAEKGAEGKNVYEYQMSSTETALVSPEDFRKLKCSW